MKKYILIQNDGEIETNSFELIGASTKRGETGKIGFFGSGLKYSIAYMMRNGIDFRVFSGLNELIFTTQKEDLKGQSFDRICINGKPTSYTVTMGPTWKEDWFVLREIYCNAIDEGTCQLVKNMETISPSEGKTRIFVELTEPLNTVIEKWDSYFADDREPLFISEDTYTSFIGMEDVGGKNKQSVRVFSKTEGVLYRKGIRVYHNKRYNYDYDFQYLNINEDRTAKSSSGLGYFFVCAMAKFANEEYVKSILRTGQDDHPCDEYMSLASNRPDDPVSHSWVKFSQDYLLVVKEVSGKYADEISRSKREVFYLPSYFARSLKKQIDGISILGMGRAIGDTGMSDVSTTPKMDYLLKEVVNALFEMKYTIPYEITIVQFDDEDTLGAADVKEKKIYLSDRVFDMGRREIALTIMEETEHIFSQAEDESRKFQNHLISSWLKTMENNAGLFL